MIPAVRDPLGKPIPSILCVCLCAIVLPWYAHATDVPTPRDTVAPTEIRLRERRDGAIVWEAEWANSLSGTWSCLRDPAVSSGAALFCQDGSQRMMVVGVEARRYPHLAPGVADYAIPVTREGEYFVFMRAWATNSCGDSCFVSVGRARGMERFPPEKSRHPLERVRAGKRWIWIADLTHSYSLGPGTHRFRMTVREDGYHVDQIALAPAGWVPPSDATETNVLPSTAGAGANVRASRLTCSLALDSCVLWPSESPRTSGTLWIRSNAGVPVTVDGAMEFPSGTVAPSPMFGCRLTPERPVAMIPVRLALARGAERRWYPVEARVSSGDVPIAAHREVCMPFDWMVLGPVRGRFDAEAGGSLRDLKTLGARGALPTPTPTMKWKRPAEQRHYNALGSLDFASMFGELESCAVYVATRVRVARAGEYRMLVGGDDLLKLRMDGGILHTDLLHKALRFNLGAEPVRLESGDHVIVGRVWQDTRWWEMHLEFQTPDGRVAPDVVGLDMP